MKKFIPIVILLISTYTVNSQTINIDSLERLLHKHKREDTIRINLLNKTSKELLRVNNDKALIYAKESKELSDELNYAKGKAVSLHLTGTYHYSKSDYTKAFENYEVSLSLYKKLGNNKAIAECFTAIGLIFEKQGNYAKALEYHHKSLKIFKVLGNKSKISLCLNNIGIVFERQGEYPKALENYQKSLRIREDIGYKKGVSGNLNNMAIILFNQANYPKALDYYQKSLKIKEEIGDIRGISNTLNNIGEVFKIQNNYEKSLEYYQRSLKIKEEIGEKIGISIVYNNMGDIFFLQANYSKAILYYQKSLKIKEALGEKKGISIVYNNMGLMYIKQGNYLKAMDYLQKSLKISEEINNKQEICSSYFFIGTIYLKTKNYSKALNFTNKSLKIAKSLNLLNKQIDTYKQLSEIYAATRNYKKAFENHQFHKQLNDSIFNEETIKNLTSLELSYIYEKEKLTNLLEQRKKDAVMKKEVKYQRTIKNVFIVGFCTFSLIIFIIVYAHILNRTAKNKIAEQNEELEKHRFNLEQIVDQRTKELIIAKEKAEESDRLKSSFLNNMSHEIRTPMNAIVGFSNLLVENNLEPDTKNNIISEITTNSFSLLNLIENILEISGIDSNQVKIKKTKFELNDVLNEIYTSFYDIIKLKKLQFNIKTSGNGIEIYSDTHRIKQVFDNLINNAIKYTENGKIEIGFITKSNFIEFFVKDTGIGLSEKQKSQIFNRFTKIEDDKNKLYRGAGLGLAISKSVIKLLDGDIWVESEPGLGTTFYFTVPFQNNDPEIKG